MLGQFNIQLAIGRADYFGNIIQSAGYPLDGHLRAFVTYINTDLVQYI
jgi:hypothetical protein